MRTAIAETLEKQEEIIRLQSAIIDRLSATLLQIGTINDEDLKMIRQAAVMQDKIRE